MADLPRIFARSEIPQVGLPRTTAEAHGAAIGRGLAELGAAMVEKQKPIDAAKQTSEYEIAVADLKNEIQAEPDPNKWREQFIAKEGELRQKMLGEMGDPRVKDALLLHINRNLGRHVIDLNEKSIKASHAKQLGDIQTVGETLARQAAETQDEGLRSSYVNTFNAMISAATTPTAVGGRAVPGALTPKQGEEQKQKFQRDILKGRFTALALSNPSLAIAEHNRGAYQALDPDDRARILEQARRKIDFDDRQKDQQVRKLGDLVEREAAAQANFGTLNESWLMNALSGNDPYITPDKARTLKHINDNPPTGEGGQQVRAIMQEYHSGPSSFGRINATRRQLTALMRNQNSPNPLLDKALNELQTDERTMTGIEASRVNREIQAAQDEYTANTPPLPFNFPLFQNQQKQDRAKIGVEIRKGGDPKTIIDRKKNEAQGRANAIPERNKKVLDAAK